MNNQYDKIHKLTNIARLYYEQDMTQSEIAKRYGVSRPLVSRMLKEAREMGIVRIEIRTPLGMDDYLMKQACLLFGLEGGAAAPEVGNDNVTNDAVSRAAIGYLAGLNQENYGIGWGHIIGNLVSVMEKSDPVEGLASRVCPLIGNSGVGNRNYHSNELVRIFALKCRAVPEYFYAPFIVTSEQERQIFEELESYRAIQNTWERLDAALVNIGNYPSVPDFASEARYGDALRRGKAVGKILNYYLDAAGTIFRSDMDYALQIPLETLRRVRHVVGICSANTSAKALVGALRTGLIRHLIAPEEVVKAAVDLVTEEAERDGGAEDEPGRRPIGRTDGNEMLHM